MAGSLQPRVKTWVSLEDVEYDDLNAEFDNCLTAMQPLLIDDYSANTSQMQTTADPGESGSESLATTLAGELARIRHLIKEITGKTYWYQTPSSSLAGLENVVGTGLTNNRLVSGRVRTTSAQPIFLVPNGAARTIKLDGTPTNFLYYVDGTQYTISSDVTLTNLTAAPSSNNTCLVDDAVLNDQYWTKYLGEDGTEITVDTMGTNISNLVGSFAGFKINDGSTDEYFIAYVKSTTALSKIRRGYFFDSTDAPIPRIAFANNDTITLMKLTWIFATTAGALTATYNNPVWADDEPSSPATGDYWFDLSANTWKVYGVSSYSAANAILVGVCLQDTTNTVAARSFEFFDDYSDLNTVELFAESNTQVKSRFPGGECSVYGTVIKNDHNIHTWDMTLDLESGVTEAASTYYYFYLTETGDKIITNKKPHDRRGDLKGYYHPHHSWRCVGRAFNNGSSNLEQVESYFRHRESEVVRSVSAADYLLTRDRVIIFSSSAFTEYLPPAAACRGNIYKFYHNGSNFVDYTIDGFGSETIGGATTVKMNTTGQTLTIISDGSNWLILDSQTSTARTSYDPTMVGFGTPTGKVFHWLRRGTHMRVEWYFVSDTPTATEARLPLPGGTYIASGGGVMPCGVYFRDSAGAAAGKGGSLLRENSALAYVTFANNSIFSGTNSDWNAKANGNNVTAAANDEIGGWFELPITDWLP